MSGSTSWKTKFSKLGTPPAAADVLDNLQQIEPLKPRRGRKPKAEKMQQLNLRVPQIVKDRLRLLAARDRRDMSLIVIDAIELYEKKFGAAPVLPSSRT